MLLYKGWQETRWRLLPTLGWVAFGWIPWVAEWDLNRATVITGILALILAGAGIVTQQSLRTSTKGLHGSIYFTLALPVSRFRLFAVRAGLGWLEMIAAIGIWYCGLWILYPKAVGTVGTAFQPVGVVLVGASALYSISLLLATFLEDQWRMWGSGCVFATLWWLSNHTRFPSSSNMFRAMGEAMPATGHTMPWTALAFSMELAAILFFAAVKVVQLREY